MGFANPQFPDAVWNGLSGNTARISIEDSPETDSRDWDQIVAEVMATQAYILEIDSELSLDEFTGSGKFVKQTSPTLITQQCFREGMSEPSVLWPTTEIFPFICRGDNGNDGGTVCAVTHANDLASSCAEFAGYRTHGTHAIPTPTQAGDNITKLAAVGYDGTGFQEVAYVRLEAEDGDLKGLVRIACPETVTTFHHGGNMFMKNAACASLGLNFGFNNNSQVNGNIWNYENGYVRIATNNAERFRIAADGTTTINIGEIDADTRMAGANDPNLLYLDASTDRVGIGTNTPIAKLDISTLFSPGVGEDAYILFMQPTINEAASGTHQLFASAYFAPPIINAGDAAVTDAATVFIGGAPSASGASNRSLYVFSGNSVIKDKLGVGAVTTPDGVLTVYGPGDSNFTAHFRPLNLPAANGLWIDEPDGVVTAGQPLLLISSYNGGSTYLRVDTGGTIGFHGAATTAQRAHADQAAVPTDPATDTTPFGYTEAQANAIVALVNELRAALVEKGLIKGSA